MKKIGLIEAYSGNFDKSGFYNSQIIGLAKSLSNIGYSIEIYRFTNSRKNSTYEIENYNITVNVISSFSIEKTPLININVLSKDLNYVIFFSGMYINLNKVYKWCIKNNIILFPYIGSIESTNNNFVIRFIMNILYKKSFSIYKKCLCFAKTEYIKETLMNKGINKVEMLPVGLDKDLLKQDYSLYNKTQLRLNYGYSEKDRILLFVGRIEKEKNPLDIVRIFNTLIKECSNYKLIIIGKGRLKNDLLKEINNKNNILYIEEIKNSDIWNYYYISDWFINLNRKEIFGMSILEAMYYNCKVVAYSAPGPNSIISDKVDGFLVNSDEQIIDIINNKWFN